MLPVATAISYLEIQPDNRIWKRHLRPFVWFIDPIDTFSVQWF